MTDAERREMRERRRLAYSRRLRVVRDKYNLPALTNVQRSRLLDLLDKIKGDALTDYDLLVMHKLTTRGLTDKKDLT